jgi:hypothetical protein
MSLAVCPSAFIRFAVAMCSASSTLRGGHEFVGKVGKFAGGRRENVILVGMIEPTKINKTVLVVAGAVTTAGFALGFSAHAKADITPNHDSMTVTTFTTEELMAIRSLEFTDAAGARWVRRDNGLGSPAECDS